MTKTSVLYPGRGAVIGLAAVLCGHEQRRLGSMCGLSGTPPSSCWRGVSCFLSQGGTGVWCMPSPTLGLCLFLSLFAVLAD